MSKPTSQRKPPGFPSTTTTTAPIPSTRAASTSDLPSTSTTISPSSRFDPSLFRPVKPLQSQSTSADINNTTAAASSIPLSSTLSAFNAASSSSSRIAALLPTSTSTSTTQQSLLNTAPTSTSSTAPDCISATYIKSHPLNLLAFLPPPSIRSSSATTPTASGISAAAIVDKQSELFDYQSLLSFMVEDLDTLLSFSFPIFWSHITYNNTIYPAITTFTTYVKSLLLQQQQLSTTILDIPDTKEIDAKDTFSSFAPLYQQVTKSIFLILSRIATPIESEQANHFISIDAYHQHLATHKILNLPLLIDICTIYTKDNLSLIHDIMKTIIPAYKTQLPVCISVLYTALSQQSTIIKQQPISISFLYDFYSTIYYFIRAYPTAATSIIEHPFIQSTSSLYDILHQQKPSSIALESSSSPQQPHTSIRMTKRMMLRFVHILMHDVYLSPLLLSPASSASDTIDIDTLFDALYQLLLDLSSSSAIFLQHYNTVFELNKVLISMGNNQPLSKSVGEERIKYLKNMLPSPSSSSTSVSALPSSSPSNKSTSAMKQRMSIKQTANAEDDAAKSLRSMLDHQISISFARSCLREYNGDLEAALQHIFDDTLPQRLQSVPKHKRSTWIDPSGDNNDNDNDSKTNKGKGVLEVDDDGIAGSDDSTFQSYLLRTGRVLKSESDQLAALTKTGLNVFADRKDVEILKEKIIAASTLDDEYNDEYDDSFTGDMHSFIVDDEAEAEQADDSNDIRQRWRRETQAREEKQNEDRRIYLEQIPTSKRTLAQQKEYEILIGRTIDQINHPTVSTSTEGSTSQSNRVSHMRGTNRGRVRGVGRVAQSRSQQQSSPMGSSSSSAPSEVIASSSTSASSSLSRGDIVYRGRGRGRGRGSSSIGSSFAENESLRSQRYAAASEQRQSNTEERRRAIYSDEEDREPETKTDKKASDLSDEGSTQMSHQSTVATDTADVATGNSTNYRGSRAHKSRGANHNRKAMAAKKMSNTIMR